MEAVDTLSESVQSRDSVSSLSKAETAEIKSVCSHMGGTFGAQTCHGTIVLQQGVIWSPTSFFLVEHSMLTI